METDLKLDRHRSMRACKDKAMARILISLEGNVKQHISHLPRSRSVFVSREDRKSVHIKHDDYISCSDGDDTDDNYVPDKDQESSESTESSLFSLDDDENIEPIKNVKQTNVKPKRTKTFSHVQRTVSVPARRNLPNVKTSNEMLKIREKLHVSSVPQQLPCRENEFDSIYHLLYNKIKNRDGGCLFVSGVPGTGKTATVTAVLNSLQNDKLSDLPAFSTVILNGMQISDPRKLFSLIYEHLTNKRVPHKRAQSSLKAELFKQNTPSCVVLIDELDQLYMKKQDVLYTFFDWSLAINSRLVIVAIANTMDMPERMFRNCVSSRLGATRFVFQPYNYQQLMTIITTRLTQNQRNHNFDQQAIELAARKVAAGSGDARRALDICRRAAEIKKNDEKIEISAIDSVMKEMFTSPMHTALKCCLSVYEKLFLKAIVATFKTFGSDEADLKQIVSKLKSVCNSNDVKLPNTSQLFLILRSLGSQKIIVYDSLKNDVKLKVRLSCSTDDVSFALEGF